MTGNQTKTNRASQVPCNNSQPSTQYAEAGARKVDCHTRVPCLRSNTEPVVSGVARPVLVGESATGNTQPAAATCDQHQYSKLAADRRAADGGAGALPRAEGAECLRASSAREPRTLGG